MTTTEADPTADGPGAVGPHEPGATGEPAEPSGATTSGGPNGTRREQAFAARRAGTRQQIIDAAVSLIADQGFTATSVEDIAAAAGVAKGSVYYNFGSKSDVFEAALTGGLERLTLTLSEARAGLRGKEALAALIASLLEQISAHPDFAKLLAAEVFRVGREWQETVGHIRARVIEFYAAALREERPGADVSLLAASVFGATLVAGLEWLVFQPEREFDEVLAAVLELVTDL
ncbi:TetR/AcrR family transcriptional regulator [Oerskovia turbata]|uniref:TetR/AcrR family transcriptional regulator n=1 Tax=Oerskovia turbata TaxID=1713 RepID=A0A4Q1KTB9_9CELL|nr:TetR/AcrR family transcriptional regulator [Oerskovia turbata]RXR25825.1 TetR/AcrR family transcriptional regulator [Oerskovia turbata]RXR33391.1 TetR/AcrR family transcriptional regulator [Oerskovia turbata]TGJ96155.1 TetR/AcrR family transcriptional regulator [Actinotalea fermentans ATCC 43279 = JCM 9966 = DSM 3133]